MTAREVWIERTFSRQFDQIQRDSSLYGEIIQRLDDLGERPGIRTPERAEKVRKKLWPKNYVRKYGIRVLYRIELPDGWRMLYTIKDSIGAVLVL